MTFSFRKVLCLLMTGVLLLTFVMPPVSARADQTEESTAASTPETLPTESSEPDESSAPVEESSEPAPESTETSAPLTEPTETTAGTEPTEPSPATEPAAEPTEPTEESPAPVETLSEESPELDWNLYFGQLHAHTDLSDGLGSVSEAFSHAAQVENLDFFAVTDHSDAFDNAEAGVMSQDGAAVSEEWAAGKAAARAVTDDTFVGLFGFEMSWQEGRHLGHLNTFGTPGFASRDQAEFEHSLENYYRALPEGSVSQFNHPGPQYGDFENFGHYSAEADAKINLLEAGGEEGFVFWDAYTRALDAGWHVAPATGQNNHSGGWGDRPDRTVVLARELTEEALLDAMGARRVYAAWDRDLTVYYELNGHIMGSILGDVESPQLSVCLRDPTDEQIGQVDVIVDGGRVAASEWVDGSEARLTLHPQGGYSYYYLRITQPDGDMALTAPVWTDSFDDMGIAALRADTRTPASGNQVRLSLELYNDENTDCRIEKLEWTADGEAVSAMDVEEVMGPRAYTSFELPYTQPEPGSTDIQVQVTATAAGAPRVWRESLHLQFLPDALVTGILVDGSHGASLSLDHFAALAEKANMNVTVFEDQMPEGGEILLIPAPALPFSEGFLDRVMAFAENGGSIILCGQADSLDGAVHSARELNKLLGALGSTMALRDDTVRDETHRGETTDRLYACHWNEASSWCEDLTRAQTFAHLRGCTVDPGRGTWLVEAPATARSVDEDGDGGSSSGRVLLAVENTPWGGKLFAAGSSFLSDEAMPVPDSPWAAAPVGQRILEGLLNIEKAQLPLQPIKEIRQGQPGQVYRVRGWVTAGTANPHNRFPETIYLQDDTGGIAVVPFREEGIQVGTPLDVVGCLREENGMPMLEWIDYDIPDEDFHRYTPQTCRCKTAMDYEENGGRLMQVEGRVSALTLTEDGRGITRLTLRDFLGDEAEILIEPCIRSGSTGENTLAKDVKEGRLVRAMGILYLDETGKPVLRVRNCEEVVYVPPRRYPGNNSDNPKTADLSPIFSTATALSLLGLLAVWKKRIRK